MTSLKQQSTFALQGARLMHACTSVHSVARENEDTGNLLPCILKETLDETLEILASYSGLLGKGLTEGWANVYEASYVLVCTSISLR